MGVVVVLLNKIVKHTFMDLSVIIPTINEEEQIGSLLSHLSSHSPPSVKEYIVVDGGSTDRTVSIAEAAGAKVYHTARARRSIQMNKGATAAKGDIFYFVHADTLPPSNYAQHIKTAVESGYPSGCFCVRFRSRHPALQVHSFLSRFSGLWLRGGDETLFVKRELFKKVDGFRNSYQIMEDYDLVNRLSQSAPFKILPAEVQVSDRKVRKNGYLRANTSNLLIFLMYLLGFRQEKMVKTYRELVKGTRF